ncbi:hypothetical protein ACFYW8_28855 [Streptomyces sp. NPDC002742]|uniref:hypothetical protein n=1 Tax=Streptomyces sp. NPDC002742 TaxID=3364663 RepID=UPI0036AAD927
MGRTVGFGTAAAVTRACVVALRSNPPGGSARWTRDNYAGRAVELYAGPATAVGARAEADVVADERDRAKLQELKELWLNDDDFTTADFQAVRAPIIKRIKERQRRTVKRPITVLEGIAGPEAEANWTRLEEDEEHARMNAIYRFLFAAVIVRPPTLKGRVFDTDRVDIEPNPLD